MTAHKSHLLFLFVIMLPAVICDLPIHCLKHEVVGVWEFTIAPAKEEKLLDNLCHHNVPGDPTKEWLASQELLDYKDEATTKNIRLAASYEALVVDEEGEGEDSEAGTWTMIYDEGIEVRIPGYSFLVFFDYRPWEYSDGYTNDCESTLLGWYYDSESEMFGCFYANLIQKTESTSGSDSEEDEGEEEEENEDSSVEALQVIPNSNLQKITKDFRDHDELVRRLNAVGSLTWKATTYSQHKESSFGEMEEFLKSKKAPNLTKVSISSAAESSSPSLDSKSASLSQKHAFFSQQTTSTQKIAPVIPIVQDNSDLPAEFLDWTSYISPNDDQGSCGSCYAFATIEMLEARLRIKYGKDEEVLISKEDAISCSIYSQACSGGYTTELSRFGKEVGFVMNDDQPYDDSTDAIECIYDDPATQVDRYVKISDYGLVGGGYGNCDERAMMLEIMENGPIACAMDATTDLYYYEDGIYEPVPISVWMDMGYEKPEFESVTHGLMCYGWGEEDGVKFWWIMNSWGADWGLNGAFKMKKGGDVAAIESFAEWASPYLVVNGEEKQPKTESLEILKIQE